MIFIAFFLILATLSDAVAAPLVRSADVVQSSILKQMRDEEIDKHVSDKELIPADKEKKSFQDIQKELKKKQVQNETEISLKKIEFEGNTVYSTKLLEQLSSPLLKKKVTLSELRNLCEVITKKYHYDGYLTSYAYLPAQTIKDGVLKIAIRETTINKVEITNNTWAATSYLDNMYLRPNNLIPGVVFNVADLDAAMGDFKDEEYLRGQFAISDDEKNGNTNVSLDAADRFPIDANVSFDNYGREVVGKNRMTATVADRNLTGYGDTLYVGTVLADGTTGFLAGYSVPVGYHGTALNIDYSRSKIKVGKELEQLDITGVSQTVMFGVTQRLYQSKTARLNLHVGLDLISTDSTLGLLNIKTTDYKLRVLRTSVYGTFDDSYGRSFVSVGYDVGLKGLGAKPQPGEGGPDMSMSKVTGSATRLQRLGTSGISLLLRANGQWSPKALYPVEQFQLGGFGSLRGYETGVLVADYGANGTAEVRVPVFGLNKIMSEENAGRFKIFGFYDCGFGRVYEDAYAYERDFLSSVGAGVSFSANRLTFSVTYGYPLQESTFKKARWLLSASTDIDSWFFD